jgi:hypothetical protein
MSRSTNTGLLLAVLPALLDEMIAVTRSTIRPLAAHLAVEGAWVWRRDGLRTRLCDVYAVVECLGGLERLVVGHGVRWAWSSDGGKASGTRTRKGHSHTMAFEWGARAF